jgi:hypothetical protein
MMKAWLCFGLVLCALLPVGCGRASISTRPGTATVTPEPSQAVPAGPPAGAQHAILVALAPGSAPQAVAARILGRPAYVQPAWRGGANPPPPRPGGRGAYVIPVLPSEEQQALTRAKGDKEVTSAELVAWPPDLP